MASTCVSRQPPLRFAREIELKMSDHLPPKGVACHKTFARADGPIDCRTLICDHGCQLWQSVSEIVDRDPETGEPIAKDKFACLEVLEGMFWKDMLRRQLQTTATVDKLAREVKQANDGGMANALLGMNREIRRQTELIESNGSLAPKLIGSTVR